MSASWRVLLTIFYNLKLLREKSLKAMNRDACACVFNSVSKSVVVIRKIYSDNHQVLEIKLTKKHV